MKNRFVTITADITCIPTLQYALSVITAKRSQYVADSKTQPQLAVHSTATLDALDDAIIDLTVLIGDLRLAECRISRAATERSTQAS